MRLVIRKKPNEKNFKNKTFSLSVAEYQIINENMGVASIEIYNPDDELVLTISGIDIDSLVATPIFDLGKLKYYIVDYSAL